MLGMAEPVTLVESARGGEPLDSVGLTGVVLALVGALNFVDFPRIYGACKPAHTAFGTG
jgi:hypothetical protein